MKYPLQSDEYDVDIFNDNFRELDGSISENFETMSNNMAKKADITDLEEEASDIRDYVDEVKEELDTKINAKAPSSHTHTLTGSSLTGILPVSKGGTGQSSFDTEPKSGSTKLVTSGGVFSAIEDAKAGIRGMNVYQYNDGTPVVSDSGSYVEYKLSEYGSGDDMSETYKIIITTLGGTDDIVNNYGEAMVRIAVGNNNYVTLRPSLGTAGSYVCFKDLGITSSSMRKHLIILINTKGLDYVALNI